jgi:putative membrane protein
MKRMDEKPTDHPGVPEEVYHVLGRRTFVMFLMERISAPVIFLLISAALFVLDVSWSQIVPAIIAKYNVQPYVALVAWAVLGIAILVALIVFFAAWLTYANFKFCLGGDSLKIKRGILNKEEVAIPYRQIQDVDIERNISYRMFGVSRLVILTAGFEEEKKPGEDESEGILPAIDKDLAEWLQSELLRRANVQKVTETKPQ